MEKNLQKLRRWCFVLMAVITAIITGCGSLEDTTLNFQEQKKETVSYVETDVLKERVTLSIIEIPIPEHASVDSWAVYDDVVYYGLTYIDYLTDHEGRGAPEQTAEHYSKIRSYDIMSGETRNLYQADSVIAISDICTNGEELIWEEYPWLENISWRIRMLSLKERDCKTETIFSESDTEGELFDIIPALTRQKIYWYNQGDIEKYEHPINLFSYDLEKKEIISEKEGIDLASPYEQVSVIDGQMCTYTMYAANRGKYLKTSEICIEDMAEDKKTVLSVPTKVMHPVANTKYCIWGESYESDDKLWVYDCRSRQLECVSIKEIGGKFAYTLLDDLVVMTTHDGIWCLEPKTQTCTNLLMYGEDYYSGYIWHSPDNSACTEIGISEGTLLLARIRVSEDG